ncbi:MAG TPA: GNAT family N-acetyltransferase [Planctomycetota bacterium]|nr:GNAT family N-acetyltransferase [Planctomycetota bacterium]
MTIEVRNTRPEDFPAIVALCRRVYPESPSWTEAQLASHLAVFPDGQFVALRDGRVVGMAASLIVAWDDYAMDTPWRDFTDHGLFTNHDPEHGRTLYAAEVMVDPACQGCGIGSRLYDARRALVERLGLRRIRAGARLRGYHAHAGRLSPEEYLEQVARGELYDPTLTFQLRRGFRVLGLIPGYLRHDPESLGHAACIEWLNPQFEGAHDRDAGDPRYHVPFVPPPRTGAPEEE